MQQAARLGQAEQVDARVHVTPVVDDVEDEHQGVRDGQRADHHRGGVTVQTWTVEDDDGEGVACETEACDDGHGDQVHPFAHLDRLVYSKKTASNGKVVWKFEFKVKTVPHENTKFIFVQMTRYYF